jgi:hypothetical protein
MKRYFKHSAGYVFYCFDLSTKNVEKYSIFYGEAFKENTSFDLNCLSSMWFLINYIEISEIEFNSIFEL